VVNLKSSYYLIIGLLVGLIVAGIPAYYFYSQYQAYSKVSQLSNTVLEAAATTVNTPAGGEAQVVVFHANYPGYILITGTSTTTTGYIEVQDYMTNPSGGYFNPKENFGTGATLIIPVLPGTIGVYFGNNNFLNGATATITVTYYY
jgi:hypothetical protein